jgi:Spherulation-specific family 4/Glycosyl hydrolase family 26
MMRRLSRREFLGQAMGTAMVAGTVIDRISLRGHPLSTSSTVSGVINESDCIPKSAAELEPMGWKVCAPPKGTLYHGVYPGHSIVPTGCPTPTDESGAEDKITEPDLRSYTSPDQGVGKDVAWVYFSNEWANDNRFPLEISSWIRKAGSVPFIRLMLRTSSDQEVCTDEKAKEKVYTLERINNGCFDEQLRAWGAEARTFATPLLVEWGTEVNGCWFHWNGKWSNVSGDNDSGPAMFRRAFRRIVRLIRDEGGARNITWVFHASSAGDPDYKTPQNAWNRINNYYPGDEYVDWIGLSVYGAQKPEEGQECPSFCSLMDNALKELGDLKDRKPLFILEFGATGGLSKPPQNQDNCVSQQCTAADWAGDALTKLLGNHWPEVRGFSWWNETWLDKGDNHKQTTYKTDMRVQCVPGLKEAFQRLLNNQSLVTRPLYRKMDPKSPSMTKKMRLLVPAYFYPNGSGAALWERMIKVGETEQLVVIANPNSGPGQTDATYQKILARASASGLRVLGYIATGYGGVSLSQIKSNIDKWLKLYPTIQGFFFDEQEPKEKNDKGDMIAYYSKVFSEARNTISKTKSKSLIISNPGTECSERYLTEANADVLCLYERSDKPEPDDGKRFSSFQVPWMKKYPADKFAVLIDQVASKDLMKQYVQMAGEKGFGYVFITNEPGRDPDGAYCATCEKKGNPTSQCQANCNPWDKLPPETYWEDELRSIGALS